MKTATVKEFNARVEQYLQEIEDDQDILIVSSSNRSTGFVVLTRSEYESLTETAYLMSTSANALRLLKGLEEVKSGKIIYNQ